MLYDLFFTAGILTLFFCVVLVIALSAWPEQTKESIWRIVAHTVSRPLIADFLIRRSLRTPYSHLAGYMDRFWLFNRYECDPDPVTGERRYPKRSRLMNALPSIRIHHILRRDLDPAPHDHPWDARTIILDGAYVEVRGKPEEGQVQHFRSPGDTAQIRFGEFHNIVDMTDDGVWTMFITYGYRGKWGFWKDGRKIPYDQYEGLQKRVDPEG